MTPVRSLRLSSIDGPANAIARWENEGGAVSALEPLSALIQRDLLERGNAGAAYLLGLDDEGALRPFHSYPWATPSTIVE